MAFGVVALVLWGAFDVGVLEAYGAVEGDALCVAGGGAAVSGEFGVRGVVDQAGGSHGAGVVGV
jgi:hypothetical protein